MKAIISGQAGMAILMDGPEVYSVGIDDPDHASPCSWSDVRHLIGDAPDAYLIRSTTKEKAIAELESSWRRDRALQMALILLDPCQEASLRHDAADCLDDLLSFGGVAEQLGNALYAAPLPDKTGAEWVVRSLKPAGAARAFFSKLVADQPSIEKWCRGWEAIPAETCGGVAEKKKMRLRAVKAGAFRVFVEEEGRGDGALLRLLLTDEFKGKAAARRVLQAWAAKFRSQITNNTFPVDARESEADEQLFQPQRRARRESKSIHKVFVGVNAQKDAIKKILEDGGRRELAAKYTQELVDWQRTNSQAEHISKSLCDIAQHGKRLGDYSWQMQMSQWAVKEKPDDSWAHAQVGDALKSLGDYDAAIKAYESAGHYGDTKIAMCGRAEILRENGQVTEALDIFTVCAKLHPDDPAPLCGRAATLASTGRLAQAAEAYRAILKEHAPNPIAENGLAHVLGEMGRYEEAMRMFDVLVAARPNEDVQHCARASLLREMGRLEEARDAYKIAMVKMPLSLYARNGYARTLRDLGELPESLSVFTDTISRFERHPVAHIGRGDVLKRMGNFKEARKSYERCLYYVPRSAAAKNGLASLLCAEGKHNEALDLLPDGEPATYSEWVGYHLRGSILLARGQAPLAISHFQRGSDEAPWVAIQHSLRTGLATAKVRLRQYAEAAKLLAAVPPGPAWPAAKIVEMHALGGLGRSADARQAYSLVKKACPPAFVSLREAIAHRFVERRKGPMNVYGDEWVWQQESVLLALAF